MTGPIKLRDFDPLQRIRGSRAVEDGLRGTSIIGNVGNAIRFVARARPSNIVRLTWGGLDAISGHPNKPDVGSL
jgi:hypothetical protein